MVHFRGKYEGYDRAAIALALWRCAGLSQISHILDWFYGEPPCCGTTPRDDFLSTAPQRLTVGNCWPRSFVTADSRHWTGMLSTSWYLSWTVGPIRPSSASRGRYRGVR